MPGKYVDKISPSEITPEPLYRRRREFIKNSAALALTALGGGLLACAEGNDAPEDDLTPFADASSYNNFYEFGSAKDDPAKHAHHLKTQPWHIVVEGEVSKPGVYDLADILRWYPREERIYRLRCVETWSMVIPWLGFSLGDFLRRLEPTAKAKFVLFETLHDPAQMPAQKSHFSMNWPYVEGLRLDEAMHPLTLLTSGMYGRDLPNQNGAPLRLVVPWKYGFKSIKSIVKIRVQEQQPRSTWARMAPKEYGFYANVNPDVEHPRWSQKRERRIGELRKRETLLFNGYAEQVAELYRGMDLRQFF
jgi:methionine sulfoxide reductase catalytic subunit